jgi:hypothetical protein
VRSGCATPAAARTVDVLREREGRVRRADEVDFEQNAVGPLEHVAVRILREQCARGRELESEPQLEAGAGAHLLESGADAVRGPRQR